MLCRGMRYNWVTRKYILVPGEAITLMRADRNSAEAGYAFVSTTIV